MKKALSDKVSAAFIKRLKLLMISSDKTNEDIGELLGISPKTVSGYLCGTHSPSLESVIKLADYFCVTTDFLLGRRGSVEFHMNYRGDTNE